MRGVPPSAFYASSPTGQLNSACHLDMGPVIYLVYICILIERPAKPAQRSSRPPRAEPGNEASASSCALWATRSPCGVFHADHIVYQQAPKENQGPHSRCVETTPLGCPAGLFLS